jgi:ankyrin repeat protein
MSSRGAPGAAFPPPPELPNDPLDMLLQGGAGAAAVARGLVRMMGLIERKETFGPEVQFALRCASGAYVRACTASATLRADGVDPLSSACIFTLQKSGVALHMRTTLRSALSGALVAATGADASAEGLGGAAPVLGAPGSTGPRTPLESERFLAEPTPLLSSAVLLPEVWRRAVTFRSRSGAYLSELPGGLLCMRLAPDVSTRELFFLVDPQTEQARVNAFRALQPRLIDTTPAAPTRVAAAPAPAPVQRAPPPFDEAAAAQLRSDLLCAVREGDYDEAQTVLARAAELRLKPKLLSSIVNTRGDDGRAAIHHAVAGGSADSVRLLLLCDASRSIVDGDGDTPLHLAALDGNVELAAMLVHKSLIDCRNSVGCAPLHYAASGGDADTVLLLLKAGADTFARDTDGETPLHHAARHGRKLAARAMLDNCSEPQRLIETKCDAGFLPLHVAAVEGRTQLVLVLLEHGADVDALSSSGVTALQCAAAHEHISLCVLLAERSQVAVNEPQGASEEDAGSSEDEGESDNDASESDDEDDESETGDAAVESSQDEPAMTQLDAAMGSLLAPPTAEAPQTQAPAAGAPSAARALPQPAAPTGAKAAPQQQPKQAPGAKPKKQKNAPGGTTAGQAVPAKAKGGKGAKVLKGAMAQAGDGAAKNAGAAGTGSLYKTVLCRHFANGGQCKHGSKCAYAHGPEELRKPKKSGGKATAAAGAGKPKAGGKPAGAAAAAAAAAAAGNKPVGATQKAEKAGKAAAKQPAGVQKAAAVASRGFQPLPFPVLGEASNKQFDAHGELLAEAYMRWLGFSDAVRGKIHQADGGIDIKATGALAQVKANVRAPNTDRSGLSQLCGDANKYLKSAPTTRLLFFAMKAFSPDASQFARDNGMCIFLMHVNGTVRAENELANALVAARLGRGGGGGGGTTGSTGPAGPLRTWSRDDVQAWMRGKGLDQYAASVQFRPFNGEDFAKLNDDDLAELGVKITAHRRIILAGIAQHAS